jgi:hypothetical protein
VKIGSDRVTSSDRCVLALIAVGFLLAHLALLPSTLEDIDSVNFALGVRDFHVAAHRPHPPGYPLFIALGKLAHAWPAWPGAATARPARELATWGALFGALAVWPLFLLFRAIGGDRRRALAAALVTLACPLTWFNASRPMSDVPGFALTTLAQACLALAFVRQGDEAGATTDAHARWLVAGAGVAGLALGLRSQAAWLTLPLLLVVLAGALATARRRAVLASLGVFAVAVLAWLVPLVVASGGLRPYLVTLAEQAGDDLAGVPMLALGQGVRAVAFALLHTFVEPWAAWPLAALVLALAVVGAAVLAWRAPRTLLLAAAAWLPYAVFHLLFQETVTTRYALPVVPAVVFLAVQGLSLFGSRAVTAVSAALAAASLVITLPAQRAYARDGAPLFRALRDIEAQPRPHQTAVHHMMARAVRGEPVMQRALPAPLRHEWLEIVRYWRDGGTAPVWLLSVPWRTDIALFDPASRRVRAQYRWTFVPERFIGGVRPTDTDWHELREPGWMAGEGWALTPETAGVAARDRRGPTRGGGIEAWVRRRAEPALLMVGGRNLGRPGQPDARFDLRIDGRPFQAWTAAPGFFLHTWQVPAGALVGDGRYARLTISASGLPAGDVEAAVEQFDLQPLDRAVFGFDRGWYEMEHDPSRRMTWRWASERADVRIHPGGRDVEVTIHGESPLRYFDAAPEVAWRTGERVLATTTLDRDYTWTVRVPADAIEASGGVLTLTTSRTFSPADRGGSQDRRRLGLRVYALDVSRPGVR